jgi:hypothetical protein
MNRALAAPTHVALRQHLKRKGLLPSTRAKYEEIIDSAGGADLIEWINKKVHSRMSPSAVTAVPLSLSSKVMTCIPATMDGLAALTVEVCKSP